MTNSVASENLTQPSAVTEPVIWDLFNAQDNKEYMSTVVAEPGTAHLAEAAAAYYLRPSYRNGSAPPATIPEDDPLYDKLVTLDVSTVGDPTEQHVYGVLQSALKLRRDEPTMAGTIDENVTAAMLVPNLLGKYGIETADTIFQSFADHMPAHPSAAKLEIYSQAVSAVGQTIAFGKPVDKLDSFHRLRLASRATQSSRRFIDSYGETGVPAVATEELTAMANQLEVETTAVLVQELELSPPAAATVQQLFDGKRSLAYTLLNDEQDFMTLTGRLETEAVRELITDVTPRFNTEYDDSIRRAVVGLAMDSKVDTDRLLGIKQVLEAPNLDETTQLLGNEQTGYNLIHQVTRSEEPAAVYEQVRAALQSPAMVTMRAKLGVDTAENSPWSQLANDVIYNPQQVQTLVSQLAESAQLRRIVQQPSPASITFIRRLAFVQGWGDTQFAALVKAGGGIIAENYAQASKLTEASQIEYYTDRVSTFLRDFAAVSADPEIGPKYTQFIEQQGKFSAKQQARAVRVFKAASTFGATNIEAGSTLEQIEATVIDQFISRLTAETGPLSDEQRERLIKRFDGIAPLFTYGWWRQG